MHKLSLLSLVVLLAGNNMARAVNTEKLSQAFSAQYGAPVQVEIDENSCKLNFAAVEIKEEKSQFVASPTAKNEVKMETTTEIIPIAPTEFNCHRIEDYNGKTQYSAENSFPDRLVAQVYNLSTLTFLKDVAMKTFTEEFNFVPELGLISSTKRHIADATYIEKDKQTGLKKEIGNLKDLTSTEAIMIDDGKIKYRVDAAFDTLNLDLSLGTMQIKNMQQAAEADYQKSHNDEFDYAKLLHNYTDLLSSRSRVALHGITMDLPLFGAKAALDVDAKGNVNRQSNNDLKIDGSMVMKNIALDGGAVEVAKQLRTIAVKYSIEDLSQQAIGKLTKLQESTTAEEKVNEEEFARVLDELFDTAKVHVDFRVLFTNASIIGVADYKKKSGYLDGTAKITITGLYNIFPAAKVCANNPRAAEMPECAMVSGLGQMIDISKNNSEIIFNYSEKGVFKNSTKIGDPVELDFHKMWLDSKAQEQQAPAIAPKL